MGDDHFWWKFVVLHSHCICPFFVVLIRCDTAFWSHSILLHSLRFITFPVVLFIYSTFVVFLPQFVTISIYRYYIHSFCCSVLIRYRLHSWYHILITQFHILRYHSDTYIPFLPFVLFPVTFTTTMRCSFPCLFPFDHSIVLYIILPWKCSLHDLLFVRCRLFCYRCCSTVRYLPARCCSFHYIHYHILIHSLRVDTYHLHPVRWLHYDLFDHSLIPTIYLPTFIWWPRILRCIPTMRHSMIFCVLLRWNISVLFVVTLRYHLLLLFRFCSFTVIVVLPFIFCYPTSIHTLRCSFICDTVRLRWYIISIQFDVILPFIHLFRYIHSFIYCSTFLISILLFILHSFIHCWFIRCCSRHSLPPFLIPTIHLIHSTFVR